MTCRVGALAAAVLAFAAAFPTARPATAADLPAVRTSASNSVAECATPGRLMAFLKARNASLASKYNTIAVDYMRFGESFAMRWDYAFFQMLLETGFLTYTGDVKPEQNNFAGLGATGGGVHGETFKDVAAGVRAHLEHLLMYSGEKIEHPVAERTRNIQDWGVLTSWQKTIKGPMTFRQLAQQWAPGHRRYPADIQAIADRFYAGPCKEPDPQPDLVALARGETATVAVADAPPEMAPVPKVQTASPAGLGAAPLAKTSEAKSIVVPAAASASATAEQESGAAAPDVRVLNSTPSDPGQPPPADVAAKAGSISSGKIKGAAVQTASVAGSAAAAVARAADSKQAAQGSKCRVWTASYGGTKTILIKAVVEQTVNYTVLDVNDGSAKREAEAYIRAYAKGGKNVGEFTSQAQALDKAFELCPEG